MIWVVIGYSGSILTTSHIEIDLTHHWIHFYVRESKYTPRLTNNFSMI